jgi:hypothetical protein
MLGFGSKSCVLVALVTELQLQGFAEGVLCQMYWSTLLWSVPLVTGNAPMLTACLLLLLLGYQRGLQHYADA